MESGPRGRVSDPEVSQRPGEGRRGDQWPLTLNFLPLHGHHVSFFANGEPIGHGVAPRVVLGRGGSSAHPL